jgi:hypothetical protein
MAWHQHQRKGAAKAGLNELLRRVGAGERVPGMNSSQRPTVTAVTGAQERQPNAAEAT